MLRRFICWLGFHKWFNASDHTDQHIYNKQGDMLGVHKFMYCEVCNVHRSFFVSTQIHTYYEDKNKFKTIEGGKNNG